jgi:hypothetical protein
MQAVQMLHASLQACMLAFALSQQETKFMLGDVICCPLCSHRFPAVQAATSFLVPAGLQQL